MSDPTCGPFPLVPGPVGARGGTGTEEADQPQPQQPRRQQRGRPRLRHPQREAERGGGLDEPARRAHRQPGAFTCDAALAAEPGEEPRIHPAPRGQQRRRRAARQPERERGAPPIRATGEIPVAQRQRGDPARLRGELDRTQARRPVRHIGHHRHRRGAGQHQAGLILRPHHRQRAAGGVQGQGQQRWGAGGGPLGHADRQGEQHRRGAGGHGDGDEQDHNGKGCRRPEHHCMCHIYVYEV